MSTLLISSVHSLWISSLSSTGTIRNAESWVLSDLQSQDLNPPDPRGFACARQLQKPGWKQ